MITDADIERALAPSNARIRVALEALKECTREERGRVLCWFCSECRAYVGPGQNMTCLDGHHA